MPKTNMSTVLLKVTMEEASAQKGERTLPLYTTARMGGFLRGCCIWSLGRLSGPWASRRCCGWVWI